MRALCGYDKVTLAPNQTKRVSIPVAARAFQYWSTASHDWVTNTGQRTVSVGDSSTNLPLSATFTLNANGGFSVSASGGAGGTVPATLALSLGAPAAFGAFVPGVATDYAATTTANVVSTAGDATLSVADASTTATGHSWSWSRAPVAAGIADRPPLRSRLRLRRPCRARPHTAITPE